MSDELKMGDYMIDKITGFKGVAVSQAFFLNGCMRFGIQPTKLNKDGSMVDAQYIDANQLERGKGKNFFEANPLPAGAIAAPPGGPPTRIADPPVR